MQPLALLRGDLSMKRWVRYSLLSVAAAAVVSASAVVLSGCGRGNAADHPAAAVTPDLPAVVTVRPERETVRHTVEQPGQIEGFEQTPLYAKIAGYVARLNVDI